MSKQEDVQTPLGCLNFQSISPSAFTGGTIIVCLNCSFCLFCCCVHFFNVCSVISILPSLHISFIERLLKSPCLILSIYCSGVFQLIYSSHFYCLPNRSPHYACPEVIRVSFFLSQLIMEVLLFFIYKTNANK